MFHFGLPSEPLDHTLVPTSKITRYNKLLYFGSGTDPLPLPLAKNAVFVDWKPNFWRDLNHKCDKYGKEECYMPECMIDVLIQQAKAQ